MTGQRAQSRRHASLAGQGDQQRCPWNGQLGSRKPNLKAANSMQLASYHACVVDTALDFFHIERGRCSDDNGFVGIT